MKMKIELTVKLPIQITQKGRWYIASCPALDVMSQGETRERAKKNITEALYLFLRSCIERGTLDGVLKQCGFAAVVGGGEEEFEQVAPADYVDIPLHLLSQFEENHHCHHA